MMLLWWNSPRWQTESWSQADPASADSCRWVLPGGMTSPCFQRLGVLLRTVCGVMGVVDVTLYDVVQMLRWSRTPAISITASLPPLSRSTVHTANMPGWAHCTCTWSESGSEGLIQQPGELRAALGGCTDLSVQGDAVSPASRVYRMFSPWYFIKFPCLSFPLVVRPICTTAGEKSQWLLHVNSPAGLPEGCLHFDSWCLFEMGLPLLLW